jgi:hypothetical protein
MNELELLTRMRSEVPLERPGRRAETRLASVIAAGATRASRPGRGARTRRRLIACSAAAVTAAAAGGVVAVGLNHGPAAGSPSMPRSGRPAASTSFGLPSIGRARTGTQLVAFATRAATLAPDRAPRPDQWIYVKTETADSTSGSGGFMFGPANERKIGVQWIQVGWRRYGGAAPGIAGRSPQHAAHVPVRISPGGPGFDLGGWKSVGYAYLNSLPTDPAGLRTVILGQNDPKAPWYQPDPNVAVFSTIATLLTGQTEGVWLPPRLAATMYRLLQQTPGVHFDTAVDLAGRTGLGFYMVMDGWQKEELVINPTTYSYMGDEWVAVRAHTSVATDGTRYIREGQVLGWEALLAEALVQHAGQIP